MTRASIWVAVAGNVLVSAATFVALGWNSAAAHAAARGTARFSMAWFALGFAAPGLGRWVRGLPSEARLTHAFLGAHLVHFATVSLVLAKFDIAKTLQHPVQVVMVVLFGAGLTLTAGLTATPRPTWLHRIVHPIALYAVFLLFLLAFGGNPVKPMRLLAIPLAAALLLRLSRRRSYAESQARTVG